MNKEGTHTIIVRGVTKREKSKLKKDAKKNNQSLNGYLLNVIWMVTNPIIPESKKPLPPHP